MRYFLAIATLSFFLLPSISVAQVIPEGLTLQNPMIGGQTVGCGGIPTRFTYRVNDAGFTTFTPLLIMINPSKMPSNFDLQIFVYAHECGHAALRTSNENRADCFAAQLAAKQGWLQVSDIQQLQATFGPFGDWHHPPAQIRVADVVHCYEDEQQNGAPVTGCPSDAPAGCTTSFLDNRRLRLFVA